MRPFRERNPLLIGLAGIAVIALLGVLAFNLTIFNGGTGYSAAFSEAGGLKSGDEVWIAGVKVGKVNSVGLERDHVKVTFTSSAPLGSTTRAEIKIKTILGDHFLNLDPSGPGRQSTHREIPVSRTTPPYNVVPALQDVSAQVGQINTKQLATSFNVLAESMQGSSQNVRTTLSGLQKLSGAVASRDQELGTLLQHSTSLTKMLAGRSGDLSQLVLNGGQLLQELNARSTVINELLTGTVSLSQQLTATIQENQGQLTPALTHLHQVIQILERNQGNLERSFQALGPFTSEAADISGSGRWFDIYLQNLIPLPASIAPPSPPGKSGTKGSSPTLPLFN